MEDDSISMSLRKEFVQSDFQKAENGSLTSELPEIESAGLELPPFQWQSTPIIRKGDMLPRWATGYMTGYHGGYANPMIGGVNYAGAAIVQSFNRYMYATAGIDLVKHSVLYNQATLNGALHYRPNNNFGITVFGSYSPGSFMSDVNIGQSFNFGGYITLESDNHWGIDLGAVENYYGGMHDVTPIVRPYYNLNGAKLGFDFGPMIQNMMRRNNKTSLEFNPAGPRPIKAVPPIAPRR